MALEDYANDMWRCTRCSYCKFVPYMKQDKKEYETVCPSVDEYAFHGYSCSGRLISALAFLEERIDYTDGFLDMIYRCLLDGACDVSCKNQRDMEPLQIMQELRARCVTDGQMLPEHMLHIDGLRKEDNMMLAKKADRDKWAAGLDIRRLGQESAKVLLHVGCRYSFDEDLWPVLTKAAKLLKKAGIDFGIMGTDEVCCGLRPFEMGYRAEALKYAESNTENWKARKVKTVVTLCSDCYQSFNVNYERFKLKPAGVEVLHITQYLERLIKAKKLKLKKEIPVHVTYHDPCHLGRLGEPWIHWEGVERRVTEGLVGLIVHDPPKEFRRGANGVYEAPRDILRAIPGINLTEMERIREYAWCCGAGGGVYEAFPDFAESTATKRIAEAKSTGADAIVTACPWCVRVFKDAIAKNGDSMEVHDIIELVAEATNI